MKYKRILKYKGKLKYERELKYERYLKYEVNLKYEGTFEVRKSTGNLKYGSIKNTEEVRNKKVWNTKAA